ncbi:hypothetical protein NFI96_000179 [Prochilodus magdalenae]|nr:hypothetical protein NFI96_000179 [Prochilodus magdalenae]
MSRTVSDLLQKSQLISEGKPARYRLLTTRSDLAEKDKVRKWTFGQQNIKMKSKIILLVGETGTGKTTLINAIVNYILGVKIDDDVWFEITEEEAVNQTDPGTAGPTDSQTNAVTVYEVFANNPISVTIIDTPGYGDTSGAEYDSQVAENLLKLFNHSTGVKEIDAVCLLVKASVNRLSDREHYIFDAVLSVFGKDIEENIVVFITHSDGEEPTNVINVIKKAKIPCRKENGNKPVYFLFNNRQAEQRTMRGQRYRIEVKELKNKELTQIQKALRENQEKIQRNKDFPFTVTRSHKEKVPIEDASWWDNKATCCSVCKENCHENNCWCAFLPSLCEVMKDGHCTVCTGKCHYSKHVREEKKYITKSEKVTMKYTDVMKQYESIDKSAGGISIDSEKLVNVKKELKSNKEQKEENERIENKLKEELSKIEKEKSQLMEKACTTIIRLSETALKPDSAFIMGSLDYLIPRAEEDGRLEWIQKLKELKNIEPERQTVVSAALRFRRKCHYSKHVREEKKYVIKSEQVTMTYTELIQQYESNDESAEEVSLDSLSLENVEMNHERSKKETDMEIENRLKEELSDIEIEKTLLVEEACTTIIRLSEIALKPDSAFIIKSLDFLIPRAEEAGDLDWVQKLTELRGIKPEAQARADSVQSYFSVSNFKKTGGKQNASNKCA